MRRRALRITLIAAGLAIGVLSLTLLPRGAPVQTAAAVDTHHGALRMSKGELNRILHATAVAAAATGEDELVAQGRTLFRSTTMSKDGESCQTCHAEGSTNPTLGVIPHPRAAGDFTGPRDAPALWGLAKTAPYFLNGDVPTLQAAIVRPVMDHFKDFPNRGCGGDQACIDRAGRFAASIIAFVKQLDPPVSPWDQGTMSAAALRGEGLFQGKAGCIACHGGPMFTDNQIHDTGVPRAPGANDAGAGPPPLPPACQATPKPAGCTPVPTRSSFINTPQLRDVANTGPYMHNQECLSQAQEQGLADSGVAGITVDGKCDTLAEVVAFYDSFSAVSPLNLTPAEINDLVAFLDAL